MAAKEVQEVLPVENKVSLNLSKLSAAAKLATERVQAYAKELYVQAHLHLDHATPARLEVFYNKTAPTAQELVTRINSIAEVMVEVRSQVEANINETRASQRDKFIKDTITALSGLPLGLQAEEFVRAKAAHTAFEDDTETIEEIVRHLV